MALPLYYTWRNLLVRKLSTSLTFSVVRPGVSSTPGQVAMRSTTSTVPTVLPLTSSVAFVALL